MIWDIALRGFEANPILGYGVTFLDDVYRTRFGLSEYAAAGQAHDQFLQAIGQSGPVGVVALAILMTCLLMASVKRWSQTHGLSLALFVIIFLRCMTETPLRPTGLDR
jgi:exopolysaccharide production protein ExoQ